MRYFKKMIGERIYLSPMNPDDYELYCAWLNDYEVANNLDTYYQNLSIPAEKKFLESMCADEHHYAIIWKDTDELIGNISLMNVNHRNQTAEVGIFIGPAEYRSQGIGAEAIRLILKYGFQTLNLHNIMLFLHSDNMRGFNCYKKVGFKEYGRRREALFKDGRHVDYIYMDILASEFAELYS